ncbi:hypothetical protein IEO21_07645 [Rhodonia placenta]|uniref:Uncharacterized protein n=1 Tax=Rhodonia placenta TaxID=104341 RepID=A0A8H7NXY5_9APHY|nr:hypothetical protein IEO21_07645 [Postia placenta]
MHNGVAPVGRVAHSLPRFVNPCHNCLCVEARGQERARKLGCASSRGPEAPIIVYNDPARSRGQTRSPRRRTGCSNTVNAYGGGDSSARKPNTSSRQEQVELDIRANVFSGHGGGYPRSQSWQPPRALRPDLRSPTPSSPTPSTCSIMNRTSYVIYAGHAGRRLATVLSFTYRSYPPNKSCLTTFDILPLARSLLAPSANLLANDTFDCRTSACGYQTQAIQLHHSRFVQLPPIPRGRSLMTRE